MGRLSYGMKASRVLRFLLGLRTYRAASALQPYGFDERALEEGMALLMAVAVPALSAAPPAPPRPDLVERLDAWEGLWFPVASAVLEFDFPDVHAQVFRNLRQTAGADVVLGVGTLVGRLEALRAAPEGTPEAAAWQALESHGVTAAVLLDARDLVERAANPVEPSPPAPEPDPEEHQAHVDAMWAWYLKWSRIARAVITDGRALQQLGFRKRKGGRRPGDRPGDAYEDPFLAEPAGADDPAPAADAPAPGSPA